MANETDRLQPARVLIVDDSATLRNWLRVVLGKHDRLTVVGEAGSAAEARDLMRTLECDVMTLDIDMPGISGIDFLGRVMRHRPMPVVMFSAWTEAGSDAAIEALALGAVDCIPKPKYSVNNLDLDEICNRVWDASRTRVHATTRRSWETDARRAQDESNAWKGDVFLLGASTGGVSALELVLSELDGNDTPIVIAQHMPDDFIRSFSRRLNHSHERSFVVAKDGMVLQPGWGVLCIGKKVSTRLRKRADGTIRCELGDPSEQARYRPSVDDLFRSAATTGLEGAAALLTGMGDDGASGLGELRAAGFETFAQSEESCVVFGMPKAALAIDDSHTVLDPVAIGKRFLASRTNSFVQRRRSL